jgi:2-keto-4-pentenoate hydratase
MTQTDIAAAAGALWQHWQERRRMTALPVHARPSTRAEGYAVQNQLAVVSRQSVVGWKIAATSPAGQAHINVDGPIAGRLLANRVLGNGAAISLDGNLMRVAEAEFAFMLGRDLPERDTPYTADEVMGAVSAMHLAIEVPDSRYDDFTVVGAPQLIADDACASWFILGREVTAAWRDSDLSQHTVTGYRNGAAAATGTGANVLGDPRIAMAWMANEMRQFGDGLRAGQFVTTGTCIVPIPIAAGDTVRMDFGTFGSVDASLT